MSARVSIPGNVRRMIQDIKEIASNNTDEEVYAMLKDCAMDPNETAQRLLLQDTFHEVKRKRDKRKEGNREVPDSRWRPGLPGRGGRGGRGNYSSRHLANDASGGKNVGTGKEYGVSQGTEKGNAPAAAVVHDAEIKSPVPIEGSVGALANGPSSVENSISFQGTISQASSVNCMKKIEESSSTGSSKTGTSVDTTSSSPSGQPFPGSDQLPSSMRSASVSGICASASDPVLVPNLDARAPGTLGTIKREAGSQRTVEKTINKVVSHDVADSELSSISNKVSSDMEKYYMHGKSQGKSPRFEGNQLLDAPHDTSSSTISSSMGSRPSSNYSSRSQQLNAPQRVGPNKEWKPKTTHTNPAQASGVPVTSDVISAKVEAVDLSLPSISSTASDDGASKLQKKLEELHVSDTKHVIIPNHLQVPESERSGLSFGSFDASFALGFGNDRDGNKSPTPLSEASQETEENVDEPLLSIQVASSTADEASYPDDPQSLTQKSEHLSPRGVDISSRVSTVQEYDQSKPEPTLAPEGAQPSVVHSTPTYPTFGLVPQMLGSQFAAFEGTESQPRDASRLPSFVVQQPFDPSTSYYTQFYRPPMDGDGRFSPFLASGAATKYNGNITVLPAQAGQSPPENGNALVLSTTGPTPVVTQGGVMQNSIPVTQQAVPLFRQPAGVHISHYHHNYIPYSQYISPFFVPPATIHPFVSNTAFPQQAPTGGILSPPAPAASATPVKYTIPQFKPGNIAGNSTLVGMPTGYGVYNSTPAGYSTNHTATSANSTSNEDLNASQFKENIYITGQQNEGSAVWIPTPGRDIPALQAGSFYNLAPQGQHMSFASSQAGHGAFTGIYHPTQTVAAAAVHSLLPQSQPMAGAIEMVGPPAGVYQQPQRAQVNWTNNY